MAGTTDDNTAVENDPIIATGEDTGSSPDVETKFIEDSDGFVSTTESIKIEKGPEVVETLSEKTEQKIKPNDPNNKPFHTDPAWQRIIKERDRANAKLDRLEKQSKDAKKPTNGSKVLAMSEEEIVDTFTNNPHVFLKDYAVDIRDEIYRGLDNRRKAEAETNFKEANTKAQEAVSTAQQGVLTRFFTKRPDGVEMLQRGDIQRYMAANPGHNAMSAYNKLSKTDSVPKSEVEQMIKSAVSKANKELNKELKAMGRASSKSSTTARKAVVSTKDELKNPDKHGGARAVAARRFRERAGR